MIDAVAVAEGRKGQIVVAVGWTVIVLELALIGEGRALGLCCRERRGRVQSANKARITTCLGFIIESI